MECFVFDAARLSASVNIARFRGRSGVDEYHLVVRPTQYGTIESQLNCVTQAYRAALDSMNLDIQTSILRRFFCSDLPNQTGALQACPLANSHNRDAACAVSWVGQAPNPPAEVTLWAYHIDDPDESPEKTRSDSVMTLKRNGLTHHWATGLTSLNGKSVREQTRNLLQHYAALLHSKQMSLADHSIRTWLYVQNIDVNYADFVAARRELFAEHGMTPQTHFIASSATEGVLADTKARVALDAYAVSGLRPGQIEFLAAPDNLGPTHLYGVTFERGTTVAYRDRKHLIVSGTASIDPDGQILHDGNVLRQLGRAIENIEALLSSVGASLQDMCILIVYIREPTDYDIVHRQMRKLFGDTPMTVVAGRICRPGWLIEVEGMAIIPNMNASLPNY